MAIQQWTIMAIVGPASVDLQRHFTAWAKTRRTTDPDLLQPSQWPRSVRQKLTALIRKLNANRSTPPIVYFAQHIDSWSAAGEIDALLSSETPHLMHDHGEVWCYHLPDRGRLQRRSRAQIAKFQMPESAWLATRLLEASTFVKPLWHEATLLIHREPLGVSPTDDELLQQTTKRPNWIRS